MPAVSIVAGELSEAQRTALEEWKATLEKLVAQQRACRARKVHGSLGVQFSSAHRGARETIAEICAPAAKALLDSATQTVAPFFPSPCEARHAARQFPAFVALSGFLRGPKGEETLCALANQAESTAALIDRICAGGEAWSFTGSI